MLSKKTYSNLWILIGLWIQLFCCRLWRNSCSWATHSVFLGISSFSTWWHDVPHLPVCQNPGAGGGPQRPPSLNLQGPVSHQAHHTTVHSFTGCINSLQAQILYIMMPLSLTRRGFMEAVLLLPNIWWIEAI